MPTSSILSVAPVAPTLTIHWIVFLCIVLVFSLESFRSGSSRAVTFSIALPLTLLFSNWLSNAFLLNQILKIYVNTSTLQVALFSTLFILFFFLTHRMLASSPSGMGGVLPAVLSGFAATIVLMTIWSQIPGLIGFWNFGDSVSAFFGDSYRAFWLLGSFLILGYVRS